MCDIKRIFKVDSDESKFNAVNAVKGLAYDKPMLVTIEPWTEKRTRGQNNLMWGPALGDFARQATLCNRKFKEDVWNFYLKEKFLPDCFIEGITLKRYQKWSEMPDGRLQLKGSTKDLTTKGFSQYMDKCYAYGGELGVRFSANPNESWGL